MRSSTARRLAIVGFALLAADTLSAQGKPMQATGTFEVQLAPQTDAGSDVGRMTIDKQFHGDIEGTSKGMMLASFNGPLNSGGYVALERVTGTLHGKRGSFVLQHSSTMARGAPTQSVTVVPDSGTDELAGLTGSMLIVIEGKKHSYKFDYTIARAP